MFCSLAPDAGRDSVAHKLTCALVLCFFSRNPNRLNILSFHWLLHPNTGGPGPSVQIRKDFASLTKEEMANWFLKGILWDLLNSKLISGVYLLCSDNTTSRLAVSQWKAVIRISLHCLFVWIPTVRSSIVVVSSTSSITFNRRQSVLLSPTAHFHTHVEGETKDP